MAPAKRKTSGEQESFRPEKKQKASIPSSRLSVSKEEELSFPRGGGSLLTPLEHKQIQIQATHDVLFEHSTGKKSARNEFGDDENEDEHSNHDDGAPRKAKKKKTFKRGKLNEAFEGTAIRIEGLSYKVGTSGLRIGLWLTLRIETCSWVYGTWSSLSGQSV